MPVHKNKPPRRKRKTTAAATSSSSMTAKRTKTTIERATKAKEQKHEQAQTSVHRTITKDSDGSSVIHEVEQTRKNANIARSEQTFEIEQQLTQSVQLLESTTSVHTAIGHSAFGQEIAARFSGDLMDFLSRYDEKWARELYYPEEDIEDDLEYYLHIGRESYRYAPFMMLSWHDIVEFGGVDMKSEDLCQIIPMKLMFAVMFGEDEQPSNYQPEIAKTEDTTKPKWRAGENATLAERAASVVRTDAITTRTSLVTFDRDNMECTLRLEIPKHNANLKIHLFGVDALFLRSLRCSFTNKILATHGRIMANDVRHAYRRTPRHLAELVDMGN
jgi:hypothetical protein